MRNGPSKLWMFGVCGLFALLSVLQSATGGERFCVILTASLLLIPTALAAGIAMAAYVRRPRIWIVPLISSGIILSVAVFQWPLRLAHLASLQAFARTAERLHAGERVDAQRVGLFSIRAAELYTSKDIVCLWTDLDLKGRTGFVRCKAEEVPFNLFSIVTLSDDWQFIHED